MNQCVPGWDLDDNPNLPKYTTLRAHSNFISLAPDVPTLDYEVAELTWENGQLAMHGLGPPRVPNKSQPTSSLNKYAWDKPRAGETLEAIVNQATLLLSRKTDVEGCRNELVPWLNQRCSDASQVCASASASGSVSASASASVTMTMDALVPCATTRNEEPSMQVLDSGKGGACAVGCSTRQGSCSGNPTFEDQRVARVATGAAAQEWSSREQSVSGSATIGKDSRQVSCDMYDRELGVRGFTSTSMGSPGNTSSGKHCATTADDHDSVCHSRPQREAGHEEDKKKGKGKSSVSTKKSRTAAIHNQSERKRRDKINQRMKTLQKLVPNSSKTDKASMLDEVIEYLKQLQAQVQMMSRMNVSPLMLPLAVQQQLQMSMMNPMGMGMGVGVMDLNSIGRSNMAGMPSVLHHSPFMPLSTWPEGPGDRLPTPTSLMPDPMSAFLACQSQPMTMDAYSRMAALFQQQMHQQPTGTGCKNQM